MAAVTRVNDVNSPATSDQRLATAILRPRMLEKFNVGLIQMSCGPEPEENVRRACDFVRQAAKQGAQIVCLPELFRTQYFCQREDAALFDLAEPVPGPTTQALAEEARRHKVTVIASVFERRAAGVYHNTAAVLGTD